MGFRYIFSYSLIGSELESFELSKDVNDRQQCRRNASKNTFSEEIVVGSNI